MRRRTCPRPPSRFAGAVARADCGVSRTTSKRHRHELPPEPFVDNPIAHAGFLQGPLTALAVIGRYLWLAAVPLKLSSDYSYAQVPLASGRLIDWFAGPPSR
jgi:hypothetical protein